MKIKEPKLYLTFYLIKNQISHVLTIFILFFLCEYRTCLFKLYYKYNIYIYIPLSKRTIKFKTRLKRLTPCFSGDRIKYEPKKMSLYPCRNWVIYNYY